MAPMGKDERRHPLAPIAKGWRAEEAAAARVCAKPAAQELG